MVTLHVDQGMLGNRTGIIFRNKHLECSAHGWNYLITKCTCMVKYWGVPSTCICRGFIVAGLQHLVGCYGLCTGQTLYIQYGRIYMYWVYGGVYMYMIVCIYMYVWCEVPCSVWLDMYLHCISLWACMASSKQVLFNSSWLYIHVHVHVRCGECRIWKIPYMYMYVQHF